MAEAFWGSNTGGISSIVNLSLKRKDLDENTQSWFIDQRISLNRIQIYLMFPLVFKLHANTEISLDTIRATHTTWRIIAVVFLNIFRYVSNLIGL